MNPARTPSKPNPVPGISLADVSSVELRAELARRQQAAKAKGKPLKYATKAEWAEAQRVELCATLSDIRASYQSGHRGHREKVAQERTLEAEIRKFENLAKKYRREGI